MKISIIIPAYNEEEAIEDTIKRVKNLKLKNFEIIVVDDGSIDNTYSLAKKFSGIKLIRHKRNMGKTQALKTGFSHASGDLLTTVDADLTYPIEEIPTLVKVLEKNNSAMVIGSRFMKYKPSMSKVNAFGNKLFALMVSILSFKKITDPSSGLRIFKKDIWENLHVKSHGLDWEIEMTTQILRKGLKVMEYPIKYSERVGKSKLHPIKDGIKFFFAILRGRFF